MGIKTESPEFITPELANNSTPASAKADVGSANIPSISDR